VGGVRLISWCGAANISCWQNSVRSADFSRDQGAELGMTLAEGMAAAGAAKSAGDHAKALELLEALRAEVPDRPEPFLSAANLLRDLGRLDAADAILLQGQQNILWEPLLFSDYARIAEARHDWPEALRRWQMMRERLPTYGQGYAGGAAALRTVRQYEQADALLIEGQRLLPKEPGMFLDYPRAAEARGDWNEALRRWEAAAERFPHHWLSHSGRMLALIALGRLQEADALGERAVVQFPGDLHIYLAWAECAARQHNPELAAERYRSGIEHNPSHVPIRYFLIEQLALLDRRGEARDVIDEALAKWPSDSALIRHKVTLALRDKQFDTAWSACETLRRDTPGGAPMLRNLALAIFREQPPDHIALEVLSVLVAEPDTGDQNWLPMVAHLPEGSPPFFAWVKSCLENQEYENESPALIMLKSMSGFQFSDADILSHIRTFVAAGRIPLSARIFSIFYYITKPGEKERIGRMFQAYLAEEFSKPADPSAFDPARFASCLIFATVFSERAHRMLIRRAQSVVGPDDTPDTTACFDQPWDIVRSIAARFPRDVPVEAPSIIRGRDRRLRIALCISGQLRGYREARTSWSCLGLDAHHITTFVHTWREVGQNWARIWDFLAHDSRMIDSIVKLGPAWIRLNYPALGQAIDTAMAAGAEVTDEQLRDFYGTDLVWVEDDRQPQFLGKSNTWKMHYKMDRAHRCALSTKADFDLHIKIRPDQLLRRYVEIDWHDLSVSAHAEKLIYADRPYELTAEIVKLADQFIVGTPETMGLYTGVFSRANRCAETARPMFGGPDFFRAHASVGFSTLYEGVLARQIPGFDFSGLLNRTIIAPDAVLSLIRQDIAARQPIDFDRQFLSDVEAAVAGQTG
jgi:tetratricopeptide (TPR) repeat protein